MHHLSVQKFVWESFHIALMCAPISAKTGANLEALARQNGRTVSIHLFGQEINPETYAITKADMLLKGEGAEADNIAFGSTLSSDGFPSRHTGR